MQTCTKVGLDVLLTPENCAAPLIDHQPSQRAKAMNAVGLSPKLVGGAMIGPQKRLDSSFVAS
jgi:hypothetical protein